ncbi:MAG: hypothetical protein IPL87_00515 [Candidatus Moraniibacteriota bacterium]|nr:MAG: hypothetical protein IPL87_00515 [Candidatus Moranbacteria bacterium]
MSLFRKTRELPEPVHSFFWSDEPRFLCQDICFQFGIDNEMEVGEVIGIVAPLLTKSFPPSNLPQELHIKIPRIPEGIIFGIACGLNKKILQKFPDLFPDSIQLLSQWQKKSSQPLLSEEEAQRKTRELESWYLEDRRQEEREKKLIENENQTVKTESLPLLDAMAKYQRLSEQTVTEDRIIVKGESGPVRGSLRNWVRHYRDVLGIRKHSSMDRGQFLFQGENTKRLNAPDREKLSLLFRSLDENIPVTIDKERQEIVFPAFEEKPSDNARATSVTPRASSEVIGTSFRPKEVFPTASSPIKKALEWSTKGALAPQREVKPEIGTARTDEQPLPSKTSNFSELKMPTPDPSLGGKVSSGISNPVYSFPSSFSVTGMPETNKGGITSPVFSAPKKMTRESELKLETSPQKNIESEKRGETTGKISFSSSHILPNEKATLPETSQPNRTMASSVSLPKRAERASSNDPRVVSVIRPSGKEPV